MKGENYNSNIFNLAIDRHGNELIKEKNEKIENKKMTLAFFWLGCR
jgi:hypothetical protein